MLFQKHTLGLGRICRFAAALGAASLLSGCYWLDSLNGPQSTFDPNGPVSRHQQDLFYVTCWVCLVIFVLVGGALAIAMFKFKAKEDEAMTEEPPAQGHGNPMVEISLIGLSVLALVIIAVPTFREIWYTYDVPEAEVPNAYEITATGEQWWFKFDYINEKATTIDAAGKPGTMMLSTANELVIPAGRPIKINLRTVDVIHSFWVPKLAGKVDMIPNRGNHLWLEAEKPGYYWGQCAEFCGESHAMMRFRVIALSPRDFNDWLSSQMQPARRAGETAAAASAPAKAQFASYKTFKINELGFTDRYDTSPLDAWREQQKIPSGGEDVALINKGRELFNSKTCSTCHTIRGDGYFGVVGPELTHVGSRSTVAAGLLENNPDEVHRWIHAPNDVKPGNTMWVKGYIANNIKLTADDEDALVHYLESLK